MRYSQSLIVTRRDAPADAEVLSHQLMVRAGMIRKLASGIYTYMPLGLRVMQKIESIVREEMNASGAQELLLPIVMPADLWRESGRWDYYGKELLRMKDRKDNDFCFGPTHEEAITDVIRHEVKSYRQLPVNLYQIQTKFRDEIRPRFGLMRGREFIMKDGYSFDADEESARITYQKMYEAYRRIFQRCGLEFRPVEAATGTIGGSLSHEFQVLADSGEDEILSCDQCDYAANRERAEYKPSAVKETEKKKKGGHYKKVATPGQSTVEQVTHFLKAQPADLIKTLIFESARGPVAALVRGDHDINTYLLSQMHDVEEVLLAGESLVEKVSGGPLGFSGPIGLAAEDLPLYADPAVMEMAQAIVGANEEDMHYIDVIPGVDFTATQVAPLRQAQAGDTCPHCAGSLQSFRGIEVGQVFYLGDKYSKAMNAVFLDDQGKEKVAVMGCYGIGIGRTAAAAIEQNHDEEGIIWPLAIAPYTLQLISLNMKDEKVAEVSENLYRQLQDKGVDLLWDDRYESPGVKFKDADLIGIPYQLVVGSRGLAENQIELKERRTKKSEKISLDEALSVVLRRLRDEK